MDAITQACRGIEQALGLRIAPGHLPVTEADMGRSWHATAQVVPAGIMEVASYDDVSLWVVVDVVVQVTYTLDPGAGYVALMLQAADDAAEIIARVLCTTPEYPILFQQSPAPRELPEKKGVFVREIVFSVRIQAGV